MSQLFGADRVERPLTPHTPVRTAVGIALSVLVTFQSSPDLAAGQEFSDRPISCVPSIMMDRIVLKNTMRQQPSVFELTAARAGEVVMMSDDALAAV